MLVNTQRRKTSFCQADKEGLSYECIRMCCSRIERTMLVYTHLCKVRPRAKAAVASLAAGEAALARSREGLTQIVARVVTFAGGRRGLHDPRLVVSKLQRPSQAMVGKNKRKEGRKGKQKKRKKNYKILKNYKNCPRQHRSYHIEWPVYMLVIFAQNWLDRLVWYKCKKIMIQLAEKKFSAELAQW